MLLDAQQEACVGAAHEHMLIHAVPGAGKTRTLAVKCQRLLEAGVDPASVLVITFTNKAAAELQRRIRCSTIRCGTFHSVALHWLQEAKFGLFESEVTLVTDGKAAHAFFAALLRKHHPAAHRHSSALAKAFDLYRTSCATAPLPVVSGVEAEVVRQCFDAYAAHKRRNCIADFDDLLHAWHECITTTPPGAGLSATHVFVDEVQDCNNIQFAIVRAFADTGAKIVAVGDADQSIYAFRGANVNHMRDFGATLPGTTVMSLWRNYRSTPEICDTAGTIISFNSTSSATHHGEAGGGMRAMSGHGPVPTLYPFKTSFDELQFVATICAKAASEAMECAVLCRTNREVEEVGACLQRHEVGYSSLRGSNLFDTRHVQLFLKLLSFVFLDDPQLSDVVDTFAAHAHMTQAAAQQLVAQLDENEVENSLVEVFLLAPRVPPALAGLHGALQQFKHALLDMHAEGANKCAMFQAYKTQLVATLLNHVLCMQKKTCGEEQQRDLQEVVKVVEAHTGTFDALLCAIKLGKVQAEQGGRALIKVGTMHQAKGLEFAAVIIIGCCTNNMPLFLCTNSQEEVEEERRLLYVAATRAKEQLCFTFSMFNSTFDRQQRKPRRLTYFLAPLLTQLIVRQNTHLLQPDERDGEAELSFYKLFGRFNALTGLVRASQCWADMPLPPGLLQCAPRDTPCLAPSPLTTLLFKKLFQSCLTDAEISMQERIATVCAAVFGQDAGSTRIALHLSKWRAFLDGFVVLAERLLAGRPKRLVVNQFITAWNDISATVDVCIDGSLMCIMYDSQPTGTSVLNLYLCAAALTPRVTTLVLCNLWDGVLQRMPYKPLPCHLLPLAMQAHPMVQHLSLFPLATVEA
jgi:DNA helicase-2/ATP-dependent DNA helicase PcrA